MTSLSRRADYQLADPWLMRAAVLDGVPGDPQRPRRTAIKLGNGDGGLVYTGLMSGRDEDQLGVAIAHVALGTPYRRALALVGERTTAAETNLEFTYRANLAPWLTRQPDIQYIINLGGNPGTRDALVMGLRAEVGF